MGPLGFSAKLSNIIAHARAGRAMTSEELFGRLNAIDILVGDFRQFPQAILRQTIKWKSSAASSTNNLTP